ncbi:hypothetical protein K435DRAFT_873507 [Dendrothele bispora CBS 962.96]|uniref:Uncharacterized protein n=1 Tax=Dendrothele bispora (strain CBS 962.96) TaxID=1314807 RepID=A0A4V4HBZ3_DENBC|nr:hypothetical protein K435DRAFT_873507 [Dendrothele bispora CBS 962.96]
MPTKPLKNATNQESSQRRPGRPRGSKNKPPESVHGASVQVSDEAGAQTQAMILQRIQELEARNAAQDAENARLRAQLAATSNNSNDEPDLVDQHELEVDELDNRDDSGRSMHQTGVEDEDEELAGAKDKDQEAENRARKRRRENLEQLVEKRRRPNQLPTSSGHPTEDNTSKIPKPKGQAGKDYSLQVKMGLSKSTKGRLRYNSILRSVRDAVSESRIAWQKAWSEISASEKAILFTVLTVHIRQLRERHPILARFENDWATEAMVRQYMKNKRKTHYAQGSLMVAEKYGHLKENSAKRDQSKSRKRKGLEDYEHRKAKAKEAKRKEKVKRRRLRRAVDDDDDDGGNERPDPEFVEGSKDSAGAEDSAEDAGGDIDENQEDDG